MQRKDLIKDVKIVEPPIHELNKKSSGLKKSCFFSCSFIIFLIIGLLLGLKIYIGAGPKTVTIVPFNYPLEQIPLYNQEKITKMTFISGTYKSRRVELAAIFPKIIMLPFLINNGDDSSAKEKHTFKNFFQTMVMPITDKRDNFKIEWENIDRGFASFIDYYQKDLEKSNFKIDAYAEGQDFKKIDFYRDDGFSGTIYAENKNGQKNKTNYAFLVLNMPQLENK